MMFNSGKLIGLAGLLTLLTACSAGSDANCVSGNQCANLTPPESIAFGFPQLNAITELENAQGQNTGTYSRSASIIVTDNNGNSLADGTIIQLDAIDTILAKGIIDGAAVVTGNTLTDTDPQTANDVIVDADPGTNISGDTNLGVDLGMTGSDFAAANTSRGHSEPTTIEAGDHLILFGANGEDQVRTLASTPSGAGPITSVSVTQDFNTVYDGTTNLNYVIGKVKTGTSLIGIDPETGDDLIGFTKVKNGLATFKIEFQANDPTTSRINTGCFSSIDYRYERETSEVYIIARVDGIPKLTIVTPYCFEAIAGGSFDGVAGITAPGNYLIRVKDKNSHGIAYAGVSPFGCLQDSGNLSTRADNNGYCIMPVAGSGKITISSGSISEEITLP